MSALIVGRTPLLPVQVATGALAAEDPLERTKHLFASNMLVRQAIVAASPTLASAIDAWIAGKDLRNKKTPLRALAYLLRMSTRPTPFALCAGIGEVECGPAATLRIGEDDGFRRTFTRPDMELLLTLASQIERSPLRERVRYMTNACILERGDRVYVTNVAMVNFLQAGDGETLAEQREVSLKNTEAVTFVRGLCKQPLAYAEIAQALCERFEAPPDAARRLLDQLIRAGVLLSELQPSPLGDPVAYLMQRFEQLGADCAAVGSALEQARRLDETPLAQRAPEDYAHVQRAFGEIISTPLKNTVQTDLRTQFAGTLPECVLKDAALLAEYQARCAPMPVLEKLRERFLERYEGTERMVPLLELIDPNVGLGIPDSLQTPQRDTKVRDRTLLQLACEAQRSGQLEVVLDRKLLDLIVPPFDPAQPPQRTTEVGFQVVAESAQAVQAGNYLVVPSTFFGSDSAAKSLGRFAHMFGDEFRSRAKDIASRSAPPGEAVAEFAFVPPRGRSYNVLTRPLLYEYEICAGSGAPAQGTRIDVDDLWVGLDDDRFFLWSKSLGRRVAIRETHMYATSIGSANLCRFLALARLDGKRLVTEFDWSAAAGCTYLPRLRAGRIILAPRQWKFERSAFGSSEAEVAAELGRLRKLWNLPRYLYLCDEDHRLLLDLESTVCPALLHDQMGEGRVDFIEALPDPTHTWIEGPGGTHIVEFIAQNVAAQPQSQLLLRPPAIIKTRAQHGPGSSWLYAKFYLGRQATDDFIAGAVAPFARSLRESGDVDKWFFVRYADTQHHLRVRFHAALERQELVRRSVLKTAEKWLQDGRIGRYVLDTYSPEYERYGSSEELDAAENFFTQNSELCATLIAQGIPDTRTAVSMAAASFDAYVRADAFAMDILVRAFSVASKGKSLPEDREILRNIGNAQGADLGGILRAALPVTMPEKRLADLLHMHCNRLGLDRAAERRVCGLLRALALSRMARNEKREPEFSGSR